MLEVLKKTCLNTQHVQQKIEEVTNRIGGEKFVTAAQKKGPKPP
jgi:hypothetical protein